MSKLDKERLSKKKAWEEAERIDYLGQDSNIKGAKAVIEENKEQEGKESKKTAEQLTKLNDSRKNSDLYRNRLRAIGASHARQFDLPRGFNWTFELTSKGIVLWIRDSKNKLFARGLKISGLPMYDLNGIDRLLGKGLTFMDEKEASYAKPAFN